MSDRTFERAVLDWLEDGSDRTSPAAIDAVLLAVKTTPQQRGPWPSRRNALMPNSLRAVAAIAVVAIVAIGVFAYNANRPGVGSESLMPSVTAGPTIGPTPAPTLAFASPFSSAVFGYDAKYPNGWRVGLGSVAGTASQLALGEHMVAPRYWDHLTSPTAAAIGSGILATSAVLPAGMAEDEWIDTYQAPQVAADGRRCIPERSTWDAISVDGHAGGVYTGCNYAESMIFVGDRVYVFYWVSMIGSAGKADPDGRQILESFLTTVTLHPERAALVSPGPS